MPLFAAWRSRHFASFSPPTRPCGRCAAPPTVSRAALYAAAVAAAIGPPALFPCGALARVPPRGNRRSCRPSCFLHVVGRVSLMASPTGDAAGATTPPEFTLHFGWWPLLGGHSRVLHDGCPGRPGSSLVRIWAPPIRVTGVGHPMHPRVELPEGPSRGGSRARSWANSGPAAMLRREESGCAGPIRPCVGGESHRAARLLD